jgi:intracellular sulfur oxidation DsrE/DsrF family protein
MSRYFGTILIVMALFITATSWTAFAQTRADSSWAKIILPEGSTGAAKHAAHQRRPTVRTHVRHTQKGKPPMTANEHVAPLLPKIHRVVIQVTQNDPGLMKTALNNAENLSSFYRERGEDVEIEFVAYGPGLHMLRNDSSPVLDRIRSIAQKNKHIIFSGCGNTLKAQSSQENKDLTLVPEARIVPAGIVRITELQEQGWTYVRP